MDVQTVIVANCLFYPPGASSISFKNITCDVLGHCPMYGHTAVPTTAGLINSLNLTQS